MFLCIFEETAKEYPQIVADSMIVDAACMNLVMHPERFDVMVMPNLYGDIVSDLTSGLIGGLGLLPSCNLGDDHAMYEAVHGSAGYCGKKYRESDGTSAFCVHDAR